MMIGRASLGPKNTYLSESIRGFNSSLGDKTIEGGTRKLAEGGKRFIIRYPRGGLKMWCGVKIRIQFTCCSLSFLKEKGASKA